MIDPARPDFSNTPVSPQRPQFVYAPVESACSPAVTIVTPFYNTGTIFHETARSVLQQSLQQWEWLIINDGSTDPEALALLAQYRQRDPRIRVIDQPENKGLSAARNTGFASARTPYVVQLDSDDLLEPTAIEKWLWFLESYPEFAFVKGYSVGFGAQEYLWQKGFHDGGAFLEDNLVAPTSAIRTHVHHAVGGYDESNRAGLEDWDFWLRCAHAEYWGGTVPEYLDWYRRRPTHKDRWTNWDQGERQQAFLADLRQKYAKLWNGGFPQVQLRHPLPYDNVPDELPWENRLRKTHRRLLLLIPWLAIGGADKFNLDVVEQYTQRGWEVTVVTTLRGENPWLPYFIQYTPDIFILQHFLRVADYPRFLRYVIASRQVDAVLMSHSEFSYLSLPYLRAHFPELAILDFCHIEEEDWKNGGYPHLAVKHQELLTANIVSSAHLKRWMVDRGADPEQISVCYTNVDTKRWKPNAARRIAVRQELQIAPDSAVLLYTARLCPQKQPLVFAEVMVRLTQKFRNCLALVAGDGPESEWLRAFVHKHGLAQQIRLLGAVSNENVRDLMSAADVFFLPSRWEGIALSVYEAMACALPVVIADVGGQRELVTPECGALITLSDEPTQIVQYTEVLVQLLHDEKKRAEMGHAARKRVEASFGLSDMGTRMEELITAAQQRAKSSPCPTPSLGVGRMSATLAVEQVRLSELADGLWWERQRAGLHPHLLDPHNDSWRTLAYFTIRRLCLPYYREILDWGGKVLLPLKNGLKRALLEGGRS
ncbi:MAG: glycosyltransferase [Candidatus Binatia bacterium]